MTIWKFPFNIDDCVVLELPYKYKVVHVDVQNGLPCMWILHEPNDPKFTRKFYIFGTGHPINEKLFDRHITSFQMGQFVWHVFDVN